MKIIPKICSNVGRSAKGNFAKRLIAYFDQFCGSGEMVRTRQKPGRKLIAPINTMPMGATEGAKGDTLSSGSRQGSVAVRLAVLLFDDMHLHILRITFRNCSSVGALPRCSKTGDFRSSQNFERVS